MEQNPFSLYDFLGYLAPGAIFNLELLFIFQKCRIELINFNAINSTYPGATLIAFVLFSYVFGFALSIVSGELVEKYLIWRSGYPSKVRFSVPKKPFIDYLIHDSYRGPVYMLFFLIFLFPVLVLDLLFGKGLGIEKKYFKQYRNPDELLIVKTNTYQILKRLTDNPEKLVNSKANFFKYLYHYTYENQSPHSKKMQNYVALYGFSRTMTLIFSLFFLFIVISIVVQLLGLNWSDITPINNATLHLICSSLLSYIFFVGFAKYYRRYTDEVLMAAVALTISKKHQSDQDQPDTEASI